jgi:ribose 5-phosphate isomerase A
MTSERWHASAFLQWPTAIARQEEKLAVADEVAGLARDGEIVGIGSGSTAYLALWALAERAKRTGISVAVIPSSFETEIAATTLGFPLRRLGQDVPSWIVDGADEVDASMRILKGRGGAFFRERLLWATPNRRILAIDSSKRVDRLGLRFPVPIEVHPNATTILLDFLEEAGCTNASLRLAGGKDGPLITETGFFIMDASFDSIPEGLHADVKRLPGVLETGLFEGYDFEIIEGPFSRATGSVPGA